ncbi:MAG: GAF domain-containing protein [Gammaproteobacteria bacterium]|nr:GAF domain-containing protein [Gammaproteobacteria bacterium]
MLISKVMILLFDLFESAERTFVMLYDKANNKFVPLCVRYRDSNIQPKRHVEISETIIRTVIHKKQALLIEDATRDQQYGHQDSVMNLSMHSVMCAPLLYENQVLGLVQVDNRKIHKEFSGKDLQILMAVCAQLSISVKNSSLFQDIEQLFEGFVRASVQAIESRDPSTAGHSFRVAEYTEKLARSVDKSSIAQLKNIKFSHEQIKELRYASLLHDFGKVGVRENVLTKAKKLYGHELKDLKQRVKYAEACIEQQAYKQLIDRHTVQNLSQQQFLAEKKQVEQYIIEQKKDLSRFLNAVLILNEPGDNIDSLQVELEAFQNYKFANHNNNSQMLLEPFEFSALCGMKGSLTTLERKEIESHVTHTNIFLSLIPWTEHLSNLPNIAHAHHERLDGSGYPFGLSTEDIPLQSKIMAIADVYDALTAGDRPYRQGVKSEQALGIIEAEVNAGKLDRILFKIFVESKSFEL